VWSMTGARAVGGREHGHGGQQGRRTGAVDRPPCAQPALEVREKDEGVEEDEGSDECRVDDARKAAEQPGSRASEAAAHRWRVDTGAWRLGVVTLPSLVGGNLRPEH
jgi:hypothetical protein